MKNAFLKLHLAVLLAGITGVLGKLILLSAAFIVWYRLLLTALIMWIIFSISKKIQKIPKELRWRLIFTGFLSMCHWVFFYASIQYGNVSIGLICLSMIGFFTSLTEPLLLKSKFNLLETLLGLVVIIAISLIFHFDSRYKTAILLGVISSLFASIFPVLIKKQLQRVNVETLLSWQMTGGFITLSLLLPVYMYFFPQVKYVPSFSDWGWLLFLAIVCSVFAFRLSAGALQKLSAFTVTLGFNLEPLYGIIIAFVLFHENNFLNLWFYIGTGIILLVLAMHTFIKYRSMRLIKT